MDVLCDTNVICEPMKRDGSRAVIRWLGRLDSVHLSVISVEEVHSGLAHRDAHRQLEWFERFVDQRCRVLPVTRAIARRCGILRGQFRRQGIARTQADMLIAATALEHGCTLATHDCRDFERCGVPLLDPFAPEG